MTTQYKPITGAIKYVKWGECKPGETVLDGATFIGTKPGKFGDNLHFSTEQGSIVVGASGLLKYIVNDGRIKAGDKVRLVYKGKKELKGGKTAHDFDVSVAEPQQESLGF